MLCSAPELGLGAEGPAPAILVLPARYRRPRPRRLSRRWASAADVVFDLEVSPNRGDCLSMAGVARDLAAALRAPFSAPGPPHIVP